MAHIHSQLLHEAREALDQLTKGISDGNAEKLCGELSADFRCLYMKLNRCWNTKFLTNQEFFDQIDAKYDEWTKFPVDDFFDL